MKILRPAMLAYVWGAYSLLLGVLSTVGGFIIDEQLWLLAFAQIPGVVAAAALLAHTGWARGALIAASVINLPAFPGILLSGYSLWWLSQRAWRVGV